jgi:hypothetical protein
MRLGTNKKVILDRKNVVGKSNAEYGWKLVLDVLM